MRKKYKCKICGWRGRLPKIEEQKVFNLDRRCFVYDRIVCQRCNNNGIVERDSGWFWAVVGSIAIIIIVFNIVFTILGGIRG